MAKQTPVVTLDLAPEDEAERQIYLRAAQEQERAQLARWIHDDPIQELIGLRFQLSALAAQIECTDLQAAFEPLQTTLQETIQALRTVCGDLRPPALTPFGLEQALRAYLESVETRQSVETRRPALEAVLSWQLAADGTEQQGGAADLPIWGQLALFRVVQAAMENVLAHAEATRTIVRLEIVQSKNVPVEPSAQILRLTIADDGCGFDCPQDWLQFARRGSYGLLRAQDSTQALGGTLRVVTGPGAGTQVILHAPIPLPAHPTE